jgi:hypothetical protein
MKNTLGTTDSRPRQTRRIESVQPGSPQSEGRPPNSPDVSEFARVVSDLGVPPADLPARVAFAPVVVAQAPHPINIAIEALLKNPSTLTELAVLEPRFDCNEPFDTTSDPLTRLHLSSTGLTHADYTRLAAALASNTSLEILAGSSHPDQCGSIFQALIAHPQLSHLEWTHLSQNSPYGMTGEAIHALSRILRQNRLQRLALIDLIFHGGFSLLAPEIGKNTSLQCLTLTANMWRDEDVVSLVDALVDHKSIRELEFEKQLVSFVKPMTRLLRENRNLTHLSLAGNIVSEGDLKLIIQALSMHTKMRFLAFGLCIPDEISDTTVCELLEAIRCNPELEAVDFDVLDISLQGALAVRKFFETSKVKAPLGRIGFPNDESDTAKLDALAHRLVFLHEVFHEMEALKEHAVAALLLHLQVQAPDFPIDIVREVLVANFASVPAGKDALVSLAEAVGYHSS